MLVREDASTTPIDCSQECRDFALPSTFTAPGASVSSTIMASNFVPASVSTATWAWEQCVTSISSPLRTSTTRATISWSRENSNECNAMLAGLYYVPLGAASYRGEGKLKSFEM